jgi:hypothetical protein
MENPPASYLDGSFPDGVTNWTKFSQGSLSLHMVDMAAFAHAWAPLERRWEVGGAAAIMHSGALCGCIFQLCMEAKWLIDRLNVQTSLECSPRSRTRRSS